MTAAPDLSDAWALTIGDIDLSGADPRFLCINPEVFTLPAPKSRTNVLDQDGLFGRQSQPRERRVDAEILVTSSDETGVVAANVKEQRKLNLAHLRAGTIEAAEDDEGSLTATIDDEGETLSGSVQIDDFTRTYGPQGDVLVFMQVTLPHGYLEAVES